MLVLLIISALVFACVAVVMSALRARRRDFERLEDDDRTGDSSIPHRHIPPRPVGPLSNSPPPNRNPPQPVGVPALPFPPRPSLSAGNARELTDVGCELVN